MRADSWIQTYTLNDRLRIQSLHLRIGIQLVEIAYSQSQIGIGKQFHDRNPAMPKLAPYRALRTPSVVSDEKDCNSDRLNPYTLA